MRLLRFRVTDFRAFIDSGWIDCQDVTVFAGDNESGKTTLFYALLKLTTPRMLDSLLKSKALVHDIATIKISDDVPIDRVDSIIPLLNDTVFVRGEFSITNEINAKLKALCEIYLPRGSIVVSKTYSGTYEIDATKDLPEDKKALANEYILSLMPQFLYYQEVTEVSGNIDFLTLAEKLSGVAKNTILTSSERMFSRLLTCLDIWETNLVKTIAEASQKLKSDSSEEIDFRDVLEAVPLFHNRIKKGFEKLNEQFLECWCKDDTIISFEGYNRGITIKIIDKKSKKAYNLENRSTGFRRFFAHFLTFSITGLTSDMGNTLLMFDEAGAAMHPITQRRLADYFLKVSECSQVLYNTHSSYMIPAKNMNNVRVVYKDNTGHSCVSADLVITEDKTNELSLFPIQSSLGLFVAEKSLAGCLPIIVLNEEDESYLSLIRNILFSKRRLPTVYQTSVFAAGVSGIDSICSMFSDSGDFPAVLLSSDEIGLKIKDRLVYRKYKSAPQKVKLISDYLKNAVFIEDLFPENYIELSARLYLSEIVPGFQFKKGTSLITQIYDFTKVNNISLPLNFRYEIAKRVKLNLMTFYKDVHIPFKYVNCWAKIWNDLIGLSE
ncbi:MAG: ATP-binding protein [Christensenellaceae bacterium]|jgi:energy-coupling factor transporter ATP-binding protein EcfA2|nr:ATP-binding protein [Christensenellaceae bacterium]